MAAFFPEFSGPAFNFPSSGTWVSSFEDLFNRNKQSMFDNGDNGPDVGAIFNAIVEASKIGVDPRVILCIIMQESHGNVGIETSTAPDGSQSAGLMQCDGSPGFPGHHSPQVTQQNVTDMIVAGTNHFRQNLNDAGNQPGNFDVGQIYEALRRYNSGDVNRDNLSDGKGATDSYVSDIAHRLQGAVN